MRSQRVVDHSPLFDHGSAPPSANKKISPFKHSSRNLPVEAFTVAVLPRTSRFDVHLSPFPHFPNHLLHQLFSPQNSDNLSEQNMFRHSFTNVNIRVRQQCSSLRIFPVSLFSCHANRQTLSRVFIRQRQNPRHFFHRASASRKRSRNSTRDFASLRPQADSAFHRSTHNLARAL